MRGARRNRELKQQISYNSSNSAYRQQELLPGMKTEINGKPRRVVLRTCVIVYMSQKWAGVSTFSI